MDTDLARLQEMAVELLATEERHIAVMKGGTKKAVATRIRTDSTGAARLRRQQGPAREWNDYAMQKSFQSLFWKCKSI